MKIYRKDQSRSGFWIALSEGDPVITKIVVWPLDGRSFTTTLHDGVKGPDGKDLLFVKGFFDSKFPDSDQRLVLKIWVKRDDGGAEMMVYLVPPGLEVEAQYLGIHGETEDEKNSGIRAFVSSLKSI